MARSYLEHYKPSNRAWVAVSVIAVSVVAIVYAVMASDFSVKVNSAIQVEVKNGDASATINVFQAAPKKGNYGA